MLFPLNSDLVEPGDRVQPRAFARAFGGAIVLGVSLLTLSACAGREPARITPDAYLELHNELFPTRALNSGLLDAATMLEDFSADRVAEIVELTERALADFDAALADNPSAEERVDLELVRRSAQRRLLDWRDRRLVEHDPTFWSNLISNATVFLMIREIAPAPERLALAIERVRELPRLVAQAREALAAGALERQARDHLLRGARQLSRSAEFYRSRFPEWVDGIDSARTAEASAVASALSDEMEGLAVWLEERSKRASGSLRLGKEHYAALLRIVQGEERTPDQVLAAARGALDEKLAETARFGREVWSAHFAETPPSDDKELVKRLFERVGQDHADRTDDFVQHYKDLLLEVEAFVRERGIIALPDPLTVKTDRSPEFFSGQGVGGVYPAGPYMPEADTLFYLPTPSESMTAEQRAAFFRDFNDHFNVMILPHEMIPGHYLQLKMAARHPRKVRAVFGDGVYTEGWGTFCERLLLDEGWGDPLDRLAHLKKQLENIARTIVDIQVHTTDITRDEVLEFVTGTALQDAHFASNMWMRSITSAPQLTSYWLGYEQIYSLYEDIQELEGDAFDLRRFMDDMVSLSSVPVSEYRRVLLERRSRL